MRPGDGNEGARVLGVDAAFDRRAEEAHLLLGDRQRRPGRDLDLLVDDVDAGDHLGDGMLDLDARVHLDEVELAVLVEKLDRPDADVAELRHGAGDHSADLFALFGVERGGGAFFPHFLVAALQRAVALAEMDGAALPVAEHLELDVARPREVFLEIEGVVAEGVLGFDPRSAQRVAQLVRVGGDLHAAPSAAGRRLDDDRIADLVGDLQRLGFVADGPFDPGTQGMPSRVAVRFASILSPMMRICSALGPMKAISCSSRISANRAFSARKP